MRNKRVERVLLLLFAFFFIACIFYMNAINAESITSSGTSGDLSWTLYEDGTLEFSGDGRMGDYGSVSEKYPPYHQYKDSIRRITFNGAPENIGRWAFVDLSKVVQVIIPNSVTSIGFQAFAGCDSLLNVALPNSMTTIGDSAFWGCTNLQYVTIPNSVIIIEDNAFFGCEYLKDIIIPESVTTIGDTVFPAYRLTSITIPSTVKIIGENAIYGYGSSLNVYYGGTEEQWTSISINESNNRLLSATFHFPIASGVTGDLTWYLHDNGVLLFNGNGAMGDFDLNNHPLSQHKREISKVMFIGKPTRIGKNSFSGFECLSEVSIPDSVSTIDDQAFYNCNSLEVITLHGPVSTIGDSAFESCDNLENVLYYGTDDQWNSVSIGENNGPFLKAVMKQVIAEGSSGDLSWVLSSDGELRFYGNGEMGDGFLSSQEPIVPPQYKDQVIRVTFSGSPTHIGNSAFYNCVNLESISIPDTITSIGSWVFVNCSSIKTITIPDSVEILGDSYGAFYNCFYNCTSLEYVKFPEHVNSCSISGTFANCSSLKSVELPEGIQSFETFVFENCTNLETVTIPVTVNRIGSQDFVGCPQEFDIYYGGTDVQWNTICPKGIYIGAGIYANATIHTTGHGYNEPIWTWADDYSSATATFVCGMNDDTQVVDANEILVTVIDPDCITEGVLSYTATLIFENRSYTDTKSTPIATVAHTPIDKAVKENETAATCLREGYYDEVVYCSVCGEELSRVQKSIPAQGHNYGDWVIEKAATCKELGLKYKICSRCKDRIEEQLPIADHVFGELTVVKEATCEEDGYQGHVCAVCGEISGQEPIQKYGHSFGNWTYYDENQHVRTCSRCQKQEFENHDYSKGSCTCGGDAVDGIVCDKVNVSTAFLPENAWVIASSYDSEGRTLEVYSKQKPKTGSVSFVFREIQDAAKVGIYYTDSAFRPLRASTELPHEVGVEHTFAAQVTKQPTCTAEGVRTYTCSACGKSYTEAIAKVAHTPVIDEGYAATCTEPGMSDGQHCSVCGTILQSQNIIPALGHNSVNGKCTRCGRSEGFEALKGLITSNGVRQSNGGFVYTYTSIGQPVKYIYDPNADAITSETAYSVLEFTALITIPATLSSPYHAEGMMQMGSKQMGIYSNVYPATFTSNTNTVGYYYKTSDLSASSATNTGETLATYIKIMLQTTDMLYLDKISELGGRRYNTYNLGFISFDKDPGTSVASITLNASKVTLSVGETKSLTATISPSNASASTVTWKSSNPSVASVSSNGLVRALSEGTATISATMSNGISASCTVNVTDSQQYSVSAYDYLLNYCKQRGSYTSSNEYIYCFSSTSKNSTEFGYYIFYNPSNDVVTLATNAESETTGYTVLLDLSRTSNVYNLVAGLTVSSQQYAGEKALNARTYTGQTNIVFDSSDCPSFLLNDYRQITTNGLNLLLLETYRTILSPEGYTLIDLGFEVFSPSI